MTNRSTVAAIATIHIGKYIQAQGRIIARLADGRVTIDAGGRRVTGTPA